MASTRSLLEDLRLLLQTAPNDVDSVLLRALIDALKVHEMADIKTLLDAIRGLTLSRPKPKPSEIGDRLKAALADDSKFKSLLKELAAPRAYTAADLICVYNYALARNQRFPRKITKKRILDQLAEERDILISNDYAGRVIAAHSGSKP